MMRQPLKSKAVSRGALAQSQSYPAPIGGWNTRDGLALMKPLYATQLDNWFPTASSVSFRKGAQYHMTGFAKPVRTVMAYQSATKKELWAATDDGLYNATLPGTAGTAASVLTEGNCRYVNMTVSGGSYLFSVNGTDDLRSYQGTSWSTTTSYSIDGGGTLLTNAIVNIEVFKRSLFFIEKDSTNFYYLPIDSIAGSVKKFPLGALFRLGGKLVAMGTWTVDGGDGVDDYAVFVTDAGQAAVYKGTDPSDATKWSLVGVYTVGKPIGFKCFYKLGGDLLLLCATGLVSMGRFFQSTQLSLKSLVTDLISPSFNEMVSLFADIPGWQVMTHPQEDLLVVNIPRIRDGNAVQFVMNLTTGAWCRFTGWNAICFELLSQTLYMGVGTNVAKCWTESGDFDTTIEATARGAWVYLPNRAQIKQIRLMRPMLRIGGVSTLNVGADTDFVEENTYGPAIASTIGFNRWDSGKFDAAVWGALPKTSQNWYTVATREGYCVAPRLRAFGKNTIIEWSATDYAYELGAIQG